MQIDVFSAGAARYGSIYIYGPGFVLVAGFVVARTSFLLIHVVRYDLMHIWLGPRFCCGLLWRGLRSYCGFCCGADFVLAATYMARNMA